MPTAVRLRPWRVEDAPDIAPMAEDEHIRRWSSMGTDVPAWIARQRAELRGASRAICLPGDDDRALGKVALRMPGHASPATTCPAIRPSDGPVGELSYWIVPAARGRSLAGAAVTAMMESIVAGAGLGSVVLDVEVTNLPSLRVAQRVGAQRREPERVELDRSGVPRRFVVFVLAVSDR